MIRPCALVLSVALSACAKSSTTAPPSKHASEVLKGTWRVIGFESTVAGTEASVRALSDQLATPDAQGARITYTGDRVETSIPQRPLLSSPYSVEQDSATRVVLRDRVEALTIAFVDDDHATIKRPSSPFGALMKIERVAVAPASSAR